MRTKKTNPRFKLQRRLMTELPGLGKAGALERKPYPPGQHGSKRIKYSDYRLQLEEKQKLRLHYDLREKQLLRFVKQAKRQSGAWMISLASLLERRLQNVVFRAGWAPSQMSAGQMVSHGQVFVNGKRVDIRSALVQIGDQISLSPRGMKNQVYLQAKQSPRLPLPDWLEKIETENQVVVTLKDSPGLEAIPFPFEPSFVTSYYSKV